MNRRRLLRRLAQGSLNNVSFGDMVNLVEGFGFHLWRISEANIYSLITGFPIWSTCNHSGDKRNHIKFDKSCASSSYMISSWRIQNERLPYQYLFQ